MTHVDMPSCCTRAVLLCLAFTLFGGSTAKAAPRIELLTMHPGESMWSRFGHTAVRVTHSPGRDVVYSFGYAPFSQPSFIWRFLRGEAKFGVGVRTWQETRELYVAANRTLVRQPLALSAERADAMDRALQTYMQPGRNKYTYDQLRDNCATRVRDLIDTATGGALRRAAGGPTGRSYRDHTQRASAGRPGLSFALDFIGGPNQELMLDDWAEMYLPRYLHDTVARATLEGRPLSQDSITVYERRGPPATAGFARAGRYGWLLFAIVLAVLLAATPQAKMPRRSAGVFLLAFGISTGLWACVLDVLVAISRVPDFAWNENVLTWLPTDFALCVVGVRLLRERPWDELLGHWLNLYCKARVLVAAVAIALTYAGALPQDNVAFTLAPALVFTALLYGPGRTKREEISHPSGASATRPSK